MTEEREASPAGEARRPESSGRPGRLRRWGLRPLVWSAVVLLVLGLALLWLLQTEIVQRRLTGFALARAEAYIGRDIDVGEIRIGWVPLWIEVRDLVIPGPDPEAPPVLTAERLLVDVDLFDLFDATLKVQRIEADDLHMHIARGADGELNLPDLPKRQRGEGKLEFEIGTIDVERSSFSFEDRTVPLDLLARGVEGVLLGTADREVAGRALVEEVTVELPEAEAPVTARVAGRLRIGRRGLELEGVDLSAPGLDVAASGEVHWKAPKEVSIRVEGRARSEVFRRLGYVDDQLEGTVHVDGRITWHPGVWGFRGRFESDRLRLVEWPLEDLSGVVRGDRNSIVVSLEESRYAGGRITGGTTIDLGAEERLVETDIELREVGLQSFLTAADVPVESLGGRVSGNISYRFRGPDWRRGDGWGTFRVEATTRGGRVPITGTVPLTISNGGLAGRAVRFTLPGQIVTADATYDLETERGAIDYRVRSADLGPLARLLPIEEEDGPTLWLPRSGQGELWGTLRLDPGAVSTDLSLELADVEAPGITAERVEGLVSLSGTGVDRLELELARDGAAAIVSGEVPFEEPRWRIGLDIADWPAEASQTWLPFQLPVEGPFTGVVTVHGLPGEGGEDETEGEVHGAVAPAVVSGIAVDRLAVDLTWDPDRVLVTDLTIEAPAGRLRGGGGLGVAEGELDFDIEGIDLQLDRAPLSELLGGRLGGSAEVQATIGGTLESPRVDAALEGRELTIAGTPVGADGDTRLDLFWEGDEVGIEGSFLGLAELEGGGRLDGEGADVTIELRVADLRSLAGLLGPDVPEIAGHASGRIRISGEGLEGLPEIVVVIDDLVARYRGREIVELEPVRVELEEGVARIRSLYLGSREGGAEASVDGGSEVFVSGTVDLEPPHALDLNLQASVDNRWIDPYLPGVELAGQTDLLASVGGELGTPRLNGQATVEDADLVVHAVDQSIDDLSAVLFFYPDAIVVDTLEGEIGGGEVLASGRLDLPWEEEPMTARLQLAARDVTFRYPEGWLMHGDANLVWSLESEEQQEIRGIVTLDRAYYLRDVEVGFVQLLQRFLRRQRVEVGETDEALADVELAIVVEASDAVRVRNNLADLTGSADLTLRGTLARPLLFGEVEMDPGGELVYADNRYTVERAQLTFANPYRVEPVLDLEAVTEVAEYDVTLNLFGPLERLNASFASDPPLPDLEVLSLLLSGSPGSLEDTFGRLERREEATASAAEGLLFGQASSLIGERVGTLFGFDAFRIEPLASGGGTVSSARFTVGKRLSSDLYVTYSYDPTSTQEERVQVEWQVSKGLVVLVTQRGDEYSVDLLWEERF